MSRFHKNMLMGPVLALALSTAAAQAEVTGEGPRLKPQDRITQDQIASGSLGLTQIRRAGLKIFTTPFNNADGYGDGPHDPLVTDQRDPDMGNRPTLQGNHTFLRVNGLDSQTCLECHSIVSNATVPARFGVGGSGTINNSALFQPDLIDVADEDFDGIAAFSGRLINPPFLFGSGAIQLLGNEMSEELHALRDQALAKPGVPVAMVTKGVSFGQIIARANGEVDTSQLEGVDADLIVRPFGRKGEFASVREFSTGALSFHLGMQASEVFGGESADQDNDGVANEISVGDLSALSIFLTTMNRPRHEKLGKDHERGFALFNDVGCADCHRPMMTTSGRQLHYRLGDSAQQPFEHGYYSVDLTRPPMKFKTTGNGGIVVELFSDLKRHDMGDGLSESFTRATNSQNREFITARLWGIADTAPYLHDGRALTLAEAIELHDSPGSEASASARAFSSLSDDDKSRLIGFLLKLRTPRKPNADVVKN